MTTALATVSGNTAILGPSYPAWGGAQAGVTVSLINAAGAVVATTVSSASGWYTFRSVSPGAYQLQFTPVAGEIPSSTSIANAITGLTAVFTLTPGQSYASPNANFVQAAAITGTVLLSTTPLQGATVSLLSKSGSVVATTTTSGAGVFTFSNLQAGVYQVLYTPPAHDALVAGGPGSIFTDLTATITLAAGQTVTLAAETMAPATGAVLSGSVIYAGAGQAGVTVSLINAAGAVAATTTTSSTGSFNFTGIAPGTYQVKYMAPAGEGPQAGGPASTSTGLTAAITLAAGQIMTLAAQTLVILPATIEGNVLHFGDATDPAGGSGEAGVAVTLINAFTNVVVATTVTNASGAFAFTNVPHANYTLQYVAPSGQTIESSSTLTLLTGLSVKFAAAAGATVVAPTVAVETTINTAALRLTFDDEFNSFVSSPDGSAGWMTSYPYGGEAARTLSLDGNAQYYSDPSVGENPFSVSNGVLDITATPAAAGSNPYNLPYDSGLATTYTSFSQLYGYFEVRAELPAGQGLWPAFWLLPVNNVNTNAELDVFEVIGQTPSTVYETTHGTAADGSYDGEEQIVNPVNTATGFHTYGVDWEPATITFYIDGNPVSTLPTPPNMNTPMYMILDLAVGAQVSWPGAPDSTTQFPATMQVDYVRAYATANTVDIGGTAALGTITGNVTLATAGTPGVTVSLLTTTGVVIATATTDSNGIFTFNSVSAGSYKVQYTAPANEVLQAGGPADATTGLTSAMTVAAGQTLTLAAETLAPAPAALSGSVVYAGSGQAGVTVALLNAANTVVATTTTSSTGSFAFNSLPAGIYQVQYTAPANEALQAGGPASTSTGLTSAITLVPGQVLTLAAETLAPAFGTISGSVVYGSVGQVGVAIALLTTAGAVVATTTTDSRGTFSFTGVTPGSYQVQYTPPPNDSLVAGGPANTTTLLTSAITLAGGQTVTVAPEAVTPATISGNTFLLGPSYPAWGTVQNGVTVSLLNASGAVVATTVSSATGWYVFRPVSPGGYQLQFTPPAGEVLSPGGIANITTGLTAAFILAPGLSYTAPNANFVQAAVVTGTVLLAGMALSGGTVSLINSAGSTVATTTTGGAGAFTFNSLQAGAYQVRYTPPVSEVLQAGGPADTTTGLTASVTITAGQTLTLAAETLAPAPATLSGSVVYAGSGQAGVSVALLSAAGAPVATTTTSSTGSFNFTGVPPGSYQVQYSVPANEVLQAGPADPTTGVTSTITLTAGQTLTLAAETLAPAPATLSGSVTYAGAGQAGVSVALLNMAGSVVATTTTGSTGAFSFASVSAGSYQVQYTAPANEVLQAGPADSATGLTYAITLAAGQTLTLAAETLAPAVGALTGSVVYGAAGQAGVAIALLNTAGATVATTATGSTGAFSFSNVPVGSYQVQYIAPAGEAPNATGPANTLTGLTSAVTVTANTVLSLGAETLIPAYGTLQGKVYHFGSADPSWGSPQSGVGVALVNAAGVTVATTVSNGISGWFTFTHVADGAYSYVYTLPAGEAFQAGGPVNAATGVSTSFVVTAGSNQYTPTVNVVSSSNSFALNGAGAIALRGDGNYTVTGNASGGVLTLGNGNDSVNLTGGGDTITVGAGNSTITALGANNLITVGPGMSFITADGSAGNKFVTLAAGQGLETISGFTPGDVLGLSRTLAGLKVASDLSNLGSYVTSVTTGGDTTLLVTPNGSGSASAFAQLTGVKTTVAALISGHNISLT